jgi:hypothetical protein
MLGTYDGFPENIHRLSVFATSTSSRKLQSALIQALRGLNGGTRGLADGRRALAPDCTVNFDFGIAEDNNFNYLDEEEAARVLEAVGKKPFGTMDFLAAMRYYRVQGETKTPLRFDYYMLRFAFRKNLTEIRIFHEKGPMRMLPDDVVTVLVDEINTLLPKRPLKPPDEY